MPDPKPALSPEALAFASRWTHDWPCRGTTSFEQELAALLAAERRAVWLEAVEIAAYYSPRSSNSLSYQIAATLREKAEEEPR